MKIILIDDDKFFRQLYSDKLKQKGAEVVVAEDGEDGLRKVFEFRPDIILLDLIMPKKDGFDFLKALTGNNATSQIPVLVFSTLGQEKDVQEAMQLGAKGYVNKSFYDFEKLFNTILELSKK